MRPLSKTQYEQLAAFRHALRRFQRFSEEEARAAGLAPQQHQALLAIKGSPGRDHASVGEVAESLQLRHHSAVGLVDRLARRQLVHRSRAAEDRRRHEVRLTARGEALLARLSATHVQELRQRGPELRRLLKSMV